MYEVGKCLFFVCGGLYDFLCVLCYGIDGGCICLQDLFNLIKNLGDGIGFVVWFVYCVFNLQMWGMQLCLNDCYCQ